MRTCIDRSAPRQVYGSNTVELSSERRIAKAGRVTAATKTIAISNTRNARIYMTRRWR